MDIFIALLAGSTAKIYDDCVDNKLITNDSIDFDKLNPYIEKGNLKFVIVIRNG